MADKKLKMVFELDGTDTVEGKLRKVAGQVKDVGTEFDETESAGKQMARGLSQVAADIEADMADAKSAAERLGEALGPEFAADAGRGEQAVLGLVAQLRAAGLTYDDIRMDADELGAAIKQLDETGKNLDGVSSAAKTVEGDFKRVSTEADNTRSVVANFAGNAVQELPGIGSAMGPLNMAIGQFGEYATEGNIKLKNFVMAGAGLAVVSVALSAIGDHFKKIAAEKAFKKSEVDAYAEAIRETGSAVGALKRVLSDAGKIEVWNPNTMSTWDVTAAFTAAGLTIDNMTKLLQGGKPAIDEWEASMVAAGVPALAIDGVVFTLNEKLKVMEGGSRAAAASMAFFGEETEGAGEAAERTKRSYDQLKSSVDILTGALSKRDAFDQAIQAQNELIWAQAEAAKGGEGQAEAQAKVDEAIRNSIDALVPYIESIGGIPESKATAIAALIDEGSFAEAERRLGILARNQTVNVDIVARGGAGYGGRSGDPEAGGAEGAIVTRPTRAWIGEAGPEALIPLHKMPGASPLPTIGTGGLPMGGTVINNTIVVQSLTGGIPPEAVRQIEDALARSARLNGRRA